MVNAAISNQKPDLSKGIDAKQRSIHNMIAGRGSLSNYFDMIIRRGNEMEVSLKEFEQTREEILAEEVN